MLFTSLFHAYGQTIPGFKKSCVSISFPLQALYNQCDLEICIDQQIDCPGGVSEVVRTCSTIKPDAPGITNLNVICYVEPDNAEPACTITTLNISVTRKLQVAWKKRLFAPQMLQWFWIFLRETIKGMPELGSLQ